MWPSLRGVLLNSFKKKFTSRFKGLLYTWVKFSSRWKAKALVWSVPHMRLSVACIHKAFAGKIPNVALHLHGWTRTVRYGRSVTTYYVTPLNWKLSPRIELLPGKESFQNVLSKSGKNWNVQWTRSALYDHNCQNWQAQVENACDDRQPYHSIFSILFVLTVAFSYSVEKCCLWPMDPKWVGPMGW